MPGSVNSDEVKLDITSHSCASASLPSTSPTTTSSPSNIIKHRMARLREKSPIDFPPRTRQSRRRHLSAVQEASVEPTSPAASSSIPNPIDERSARLHEARKSLAALCSESAAAGLDSFHEAVSSILEEFGLDAAEELMHGLQDVVRDTFVLWLDAALKERNQESLEIAAWLKHNKSAHDRSPWPSDHLLLLFGIFGPAFLSNSFLRALKKFAGPIKKKAYEQLQPSDQLEAWHKDFEILQSTRQSLASDNELPKWSAKLLRDANVTKDSRPVLLTSQVHSRQAERSTTDRSAPTDGHGTADHSRSHNPQHRPTVVPEPSGDGERSTSLEDETLDDSVEVGRHPVTYQDEPSSPAPLRDWEASSPFRPITPSVEDPVLGLPHAAEDDTKGDISDPELGAEALADLEDTFDLAAGSHSVQSTPKVSVKDIQLNDALPAPKTSSEQVIVACSSVMVEQNPPAFNSTHPPLSTIPPPRRSPFEFSDRASTLPAAASIVQPRKQLLTSMAASHRHAGSKQTTPKTKRMKRSLLDTALESPSAKRSRVTIIESDSPELATKNPSAETSLTAWSSRMKRLSASGWLNDEDMIETLDVLTPDRRNILCLHPVILQSESRKVARFRDQKLVVIPVHLPAAKHWAIAIVNVSNSTIETFEAFQSEKWCQEAFRRVYGSAQKLVGPRPWMYKPHVAAPSFVQDNTDDCGIIAVEYALHRMADQSANLPAKPNPTFWRHIGLALFQPDTQGALPRTTFCSDISSEILKAHDTSLQFLQALLTSVEEQNELLADSAAHVTTLETTLHADRSDALPTAFLDMTRALLEDKRLLFTQIQRSTLKSGEAEVAIGRVARFSLVLGRAFQRQRHALDEQHAQEEECARIRREKESVKAKRQRDLEQRKAKLQSTREQLKQDAARAEELAKAIEDEEAEHHYD